MNQEVTIEMSQSGDSLYCTLNEEIEVRHTQEVTRDHCMVDRGPNEEVIGVGFQNISFGARTEGLPEDVRSVVEQKLFEEGIPTAKIDPASSGVYIQFQDCPLSKTLGDGGTMITVELCGDGTLRGVDVALGTQVPISLVNVPEEKREQVRKIIESLGFEANITD